MTNPEKDVKLPQLICQEENTCLVWFILNFGWKLHPRAEMLIAMTVRCGPVGASPEKSRVDQKAGIFLL